MMELENGMVSGAMPYNQSDAPAKAIKCPGASGRRTVKKLLLSTGASGFAQTVSKPKLAICLRLNWQARCA